ncbi:hypothetical protein [Marinoscillum sp.]|uniref:hypothetical protein n=1 Tax=Marinoscillum sp. TaxID=2024838 RepID=UPI003BA94F8F
MKASAITLIITLIYLVEANGQRPFARTYAERTSTHFQFGVAGGLELKKGMEIGGFLHNDPRQNEGSKATDMDEGSQTFNGYGAYLSIPLLRQEEADILFNLRAGSINGPRITALPSVLAQYHLFEFVEIELGMSLQQWKPTILSGLKIRFSDMNLRTLVRQPFKKYI